MSDYDDKPITWPEEDILGFDPLAIVIADSISKMEEPEGTVIAVNGPWGSGKSSVVNLVRHHLFRKGDAGPKIVDFKCWWFRGEEALTLAFFRELSAALNRSVGQEAMESLSRLGTQILGITGPILNAVGATGAEKLTTFISNMIKPDESAEALYEKLVKALREGTDRYLIIIDDIDRLSPDEAILIFRLVKSVGGLPNVMYLLAYDRQLAEKIVAERYPSEGPHYLEKIVQASFDLPVPSQASLNQEFSRRLNKVIGIEGFQDKTYFRNLYNDLIAPEIKTPRDLVRILNPLKITWAAVGKEVNPADFLCLETLRIQRPELYRRLKTNKSRVTGSEPFWTGEPSPEHYDAVFLEQEPESEHERLRNGLTRLFPALQRVWTEFDHASDPTDNWDRQRRVCSPQHFDTYFRFSLSENAVSMKEINVLIASTGDSERIRRLFLDAAKIKLANGGTKAQVFLEELGIRANDVPEDHIGNLLKSIYSVADNLALEESKDDSRFMMYGNTLHQLLGLTLRLTMERLTLEKRSFVIREACNDATLACLTLIAGAACDEYLSKENGIPKPPKEHLTTQSHAEELKALSIERIRKAADDGSLIKCPQLNRVLLWWQHAEGGDTVRLWTNSVIHQDEVAIVRIAEAFTGSQSTSHFRDSVPEQSDTAVTGQLKFVADLQVFRARAEQVLREGVLEAEAREKLEGFLAAWRGQETAALAHGFTRNP